MILVTKKYTKHGSDWQLDSTARQDYTLELWESNVVGSMDFYEKLGGTKSLVKTKKRLTSISPDGDRKVIRQLIRKEQENES